MPTGRNEFKLQALGYISVYILCMVGRFIKCEICLKARLGRFNGIDPAAPLLIDLKQREPLQVPSKCVTQICITTENAITILLGETNAFASMKQKCV